MEQAFMAFQHLTNKIFSETQNRQRYNLKESDFEQNQEKMYLIFWREFSYQFYIINFKGTKLKKEQLKKK